MVNVLDVLRPFLERVMDGGRTNLGLDGHGTVTGWSRDGHVIVTAWSRYGHGMITVW